MEQQSLTGDIVEEERERPSTHKWCPECEDWVIGSEQHRHPHEIYPSKEDVPSEDGGSSEKREQEDDEDDEPQEIAKKYTVTKMVERRICVDVYASDEREAKSQAKDKFRDGEGAECGGHHLHTDVDFVETIYEDDEEAEEVPGWPW